MSKKIGLFLLIIVLASCLGAGDESTDIVEYVWVKGKLSEIARDSQAVVTINAEEIRSLPVRDLVDVLALLPGVHLSRKGPMGAAFDLSFRGGNFEQTLVMIDGIPWNNPQTGHFSANLPVSLSEVDSVQLIRGGNGARYGSAFAGAVNIVTRRKSALSGSLSGGEYGLFSAAFSGGFALAEGVKVQAGVTRDQSDGFHPGTEIRNLLFNASFSWENRIMALNVDYGQGSKDFGAAGFYAPLPSREECDSSMFNLRWHLKGNGALVPLRLALSHQTHWDYFELDRNRPDYFKNQSSTDRFLLMLESAFNTSIGEVRLGGDLVTDHMDSLAMGAPREKSANLYVNGKWGGSVITVDWGLRSEWWLGQSPGLVYYAGLAYHPSPLWLVKAGVGRSRRKPSFTERLYRSPANSGDESLLPESSDNFEISLITPRPFGVFEFSLFFRHQRGTIDWINLNPQGAVFWQAINLEPYNVGGIELTYALELGRSRLNLGFERSWSKGAPGVGYESKYGFRIPDLVIRANGLTPVNDWLSFNWSYQFKRLMSSSDSAHLLDFQLQVQLSSKISLNFLAQNVANELLEEIPGVRIAGRWLSAGIRFRY